MATPLLHTEEPLLTRDGERIHTYAAWLRREERVPAIIVLHDVHGLSEFYKDITRRVAQEGFFALAPDLYSREAAPLLTTSDAARRWIQQLDDGRILADIDSAVRFLGIRPEVRSRAIGITGFCMGGQYALMAACSVSGLTACVSFYGMLRYAEKNERRPAGPLELAAQLSCPYLGLFGEDDPLIPRADIKELESTLRRAGHTFQTKVYPAAGHAFCNEQRPDAYRPEAAKDAWLRAINFFRTHLLAQ